MPIVTRHMAKLAELKEKAEFKEKAELNVVSHLTNFEQEFVKKCQSLLNITESATTSLMTMFAVIDTYKLLNEQIVEVYRQNPKRWAPFILVSRDKAIELLNELTFEELKQTNIDTLNQCKTELTTAISITTTLILEFAN